MHKKTAATYETVVLTAFRNGRTGTCRTVCTETVEFCKAMVHGNKKKIDFRYIELMQTGDNLNYFKKYHVPSSVFKDYLNRNKWNSIDRASEAGPSINYVSPNSNGTFGTIAPYSREFCKSCNSCVVRARSRVSCTSIRTVYNNITLRSR